jgi:predicted hydrocarbon binding protein
MVDTVRVPEQFEPIFAQAEDHVAEYFRDMERDPTQGTIHIGGDRYILIRGEAIFGTLRSRMNEQFGREVTEVFLYDLAKTIGRSDAERFADKMNLEDPIQKLSAGPVHFSHSGWAFVDILPESAPAPNEDYFLVYNHPNTFESEQVLKSGQQSDKPVCVFSAGYSAGWCSFSFGIDLDAEELTCTAAGDRDCCFVMAPPSRIRQKAEEYAEEHLGG